jgi:hypothetical protein
MSPVKWRDCNSLQCKEKLLNRSESFTEVIEGEMNPRKKVLSLKHSGEARQGS